MCMATGAMGLCRLGILYHLVHDAVDSLYYTSIKVEHFMCDGLVWHMKQETPQ